jgi:hypothetical protein
VNQVRRIDENDGQIGFWIVAHEVGRKHPAIRQRDFHPGRAMNHVAIGENEAIRRNDKARPAAAGFRPPPVVALIALDANGDVTNVQFLPGASLLASLAAAPYGFSGTAIAGKFALGTNTLAVVEKKHNTMNQAFHAASHNGRLSRIACRVWAMT